MESKKVSELARELEEKMVERGQIPNAVSQYHYIFSVFIAYSEKYASGEFSRNVLEKCLTEHYGIVLYSAGIKVIKRLQFGRLSSYVKGILAPRLPTDS